MKKLLTILVFVSIALSACKKAPIQVVEQQVAPGSMEESSDVKQTIPYVQPRITYFQDPKTELCFAMVYKIFNKDSNYETRVFALTNVPCGTVRNHLTKW